MAFFLQMFLTTACITCTVVAYVNRIPIVTLHQRDHHIPIHLGSEDLFIPKFNNLHLSKPRPLKEYTLTTEDLKKFYSEVAKINKKPKYVKNTSVSKLKSSWKADGSKKCCGNEWLTIPDKVVVPLRFTEPVFGHEHNPTDQFYGYRNSDIKPVVEHIEDDVKYDFRTKKHYI